MLFLILISVLILAIYWYGTRNFNYWKDRGVIYEKPIPFFGNALQPYFQNICRSDWFLEMYRKYPNERYVGTYMGNKPTLLIRDPELIKHVMVSDFSHFAYRGLAFGKNDGDPFSKNVLTADGDLWKLLRQKLTSAFSSAKLKAMFPLIIEQAGKLVKLGETYSESGKDVDVYELMARYTTDFIGACGFGIDAKSLSDESSVVRSIGKRLFIMTPKRLTCVMLKSCFPDIFRNLTYFDSAVEKDVIDLVYQIMAQRNYEPSTRHDFIDIMLELRKKKKVVGESTEEFNPDGSPKIVEIPITDILIAAQVFIFFAAGFDTSSYASSTLLHLLAYHPEEQDRCRKDIDEVLAKHEGKLSYDSLKEMKYLELAMKESMRLVPSPSAIGRMCSKKYTFPGTNLTIDENTLIVTSIQGMQTDKKYFEDPEEFRPQRWNSENIRNVPKHVYSPFGDGPRACIGERLGIMQSLAGVATILNHFYVTPSKSSLRYPLYDPHSDAVKIMINGLPLLLTKRQQ